MITKKKLGKKIRGLRDDLDLSQADLAKRIDVSRPAVSQIESGDRSLESDELALLSKIFSISIDDLLEVSEYKKTNKIHTKHSEPDVRISVPKINKNKFKEVILYILEQCGAKPNIGETVLYKLLYFSDFDFYEIFETHLTGAQYRKIAHGPAPCEFTEVVSEMINSKEIKRDTNDYYGKSQKRYLPLRKADLTKFQANEIKVIDDVVDRLSDMNATEISEYSHNDIPWEVAQDNQIMNYELTFYRKPAYSRRSYVSDM